MNKIFPVLLVIIVTFLGCSSDSETSLTLKNSAAGTVYLNFKGEITTVPAGKTVVLTKLPRGSYEFATTYTIPAGASKSSAEGDLSGAMTFKAGTKIFVYYTSVFADDTYTLYATKTSSDNLEDEGNPIFP